jgi:hypothetical protein
MLTTTLLSDVVSATHPLPDQLVLPSPIEHAWQRHIPQRRMAPFQIDIHSSLSEVLWRRLHASGHEEINLLSRIPPRPPGPELRTNLPLDHVSRPARP